MFAFGRLLLGALFVISGVRKVLGWPAALAYFQSRGFPVQDIAGYPLYELVLIGSVVIEVLGGLMLISGLGAQPAAIVLALFTIGAAILGHNFWTLQDAGQYNNQLNHFLKNVAIAGGLLAVAAQSRTHKYE